jgi:23S rRNA (adenine-N6)-dimethyltransferase
MVDIKYSQNFYKNKRNLEKIIKSINFKPKDIIIDIGAGEGIISKELSKYSEKILAYEKDSELANVLKQKMEDYPQVDVINKDFLESELPEKSFKVFANIPFSITTEIITKITDINSKFTEGYLFLQKEAADRFVGEPKNTQIATILSSRYEIKIIERFNQKDFIPQPSVDIVLLKLKMKKNPEGEYLLFRDFVTYIFNQINKTAFDTLKQLFTYKQLKYIKEHLDNKLYIKPSDIPTDYYLELFKHFKSNGDKYLNRVRGYYNKHNKQHINIRKENRTRI